MPVLQGFRSFVILQLLTLETIAVQRVQDLLWQK